MYLYKYIYIVYISTGKQAINDNLEIIQFE